MDDSGAGEGPLKGAILIAGPTASGKSALALEIARQTGGAIVNADSMQVYSVLRVLTARPTDADLAAAPHHLYGHVHPATAYSTGQWQRDVEALLASGALNGRRPIFVGGTGLYFRALLGGLAGVPEVPADVRDRWRARLTGEGAHASYGELARRDPEMAARLKPGDGQRIVRALEVIDATGRSILDWQASKGRPLVDPQTATRLVMEPKRPLLHARIESRFDRMVEAGALDEVKALMDLRLDPSLPAIKAIGVRELGEALSGRIALPAAIQLAKIATRQYCKRQSTWFRNQLGNEWLRLTEAHDIGRTHEFRLSDRT